jgi:PAS domain S-box-containing protein
MKSIESELLFNSSLELDKVINGLSLSNKDHIFFLEDLKSRISKLLDSGNSINSNFSQISQSSILLSERIKNNIQQIDPVLSKISSLNFSINEINEKLKLIDKISDQTNLLALNATIEAARAGEHGKSFAVVANEVKELSKITKQAQLEISESFKVILKEFSYISTQIEESKTSNNDLLVKINSNDELLHSCRDIFRELDHNLNSTNQSLCEINKKVEKTNSDLKETNVISQTFKSLIDFLLFHDEIQLNNNPLERLAPLLDKNVISPLRFTSQEEELILSKEDVIISMTDSSGRITFANHSFYEFAEYENGSLIGKPHNIIRHPDMPSAAFLDLWRIIREKNIWSGYVKNMSRLGKFYWVKAIVFPILNQDKIQGYVSVRRKPEEGRITDAINAYRRLP